MLVSSGARLRICPHKERSILPPATSVLSNRRMGAVAALLRQVFCGRQIAFSTSALACRKLSLPAIRLRASAHSRIWVNVFLPCHENAILEQYGWLAERLKVLIWVAGWF